MLVRYWQAALIAAILTLMGNVVWAQQASPCCKCEKSTGCCQKAKCCASKDCCATGDCCKDGKCCKEQKCSKNGDCGYKVQLGQVTLGIRMEVHKADDCCCKSGKCDEKCTCCKDNKCDCRKGGDCCCGKSDKCCCKDKTSVTKTTGCPFLDNMAKRVAIIMVMPSPLPTIGMPHAEAMTLPLPPPLPVPPQVVMPAPFPPPPPLLTPPGVPVPTMTAPVLPPQTVAMPAPPAGCYPCPTVANGFSAPMPTKVNTATETGMQLMNLAGDVCYLARTPSMPGLCMAALNLFSDLCPMNCADTAPRYVNHPPMYIPPAPLFPAQAACHANGGACVVGPGACGAIYGPCGTIHANGGPCVTCPVGAGAIGTPIEIPNCGSTGSIVLAPQSTVVSCTAAAPATAAKIHISATPSSEGLEMKVGGTCVRCKKMTVTIGESEIALSRFDDRVRVRGEDLKATAASVRSDGKDHLILEGDVVLHYKKDGQSANVTGERVELNLCSGSVAIKGANTLSSPAVHIERVDR